MNLLYHWLVGFLAITIAAYIMQGLRPDAVALTLPGAVVATVVLGAINMTIRPLVAILTLPLNLLTLGLFSLVVNGLMIMLVAAIVRGFTVAGFFAAFLFALILSLVNWVFHFWIHKDLV